MALADAGAAVAILARDEEKNQAVTGRTPALGVPALALAVDLMKRAELKPALDEVERSSVRSISWSTMPPLRF